MAYFLRNRGIGIAIWGIIAGCGERPGGAGAKVFLALGICLAAVFLVFYLVVKGREKD
ncbi:MAG: hypothetical protein NTX30_03275 [Deltaproteobacteria bacterium]|jgi:hypothetical protein|nr:hypothetical protein [Deltaproteobacteria bacterium]